MIHHLFIVHHFNASRKINKIPSNMTLTSNDSVKNPPSRAILPQSSKCAKGWNESQDSPLISSLFRQISLQTLANRSMHCIISGPVNNPSLFTVHPIFNFLFPSCQSLKTVIYILSVFHKLDFYRIIEHYIEFFDLPS